MFDVGRSLPWPAWVLRLRRGPAMLHGRGPRLAGHSLWRVSIVAIARVLAAPAGLWALLRLLVLRLLELRLLMLLWLLVLWLLVLRLLELRLLMLLRLLLMLRLLELRLLMLLWLLLCRLLLLVLLRRLLVLRLLALLRPLLRRLVSALLMPITFMIVFVGQRLAGAEPKQEDKAGQPHSSRILVRSMVHDR
jgi:hypothetical protein